ncbi:hypothetical protein [Streptomyces rimosus]|uniref:hypothetical protein n=1 Tax=Streptomyces rimosus TaxID=1927 RepID=UPI000A8F2E92
MPPQRIHLGHPPAAVLSVTSPEKTANARSYDYTASLTRRRSTTTSSPTALATLHLA